MRIRRRSKEKGRRQKVDRKGEKSRKKTKKKA